VTESRMFYKTDELEKRQRWPVPDPLSVRAQLPEHVTRTMRGIRGMTDRAPKFERIGLLRKGAAKPNDRQPGRDLGPVFRFVSDIPEVMDLFTAAFGNEPRELTVYLPYRTADEVFATCKERWIASQLLHRCDGVTCSVWYDATGYHVDPIPCPGGCTVQGRLEVIIKELQHLACVTVLTGSKHDVMRLTEQLRAYELMRGSLCGIPFHLMRRKVKVSTPEIDKATGKPTGKRVRREKWLLSIEPESKWVELQIEAMRVAGLPMIEAPELNDDAPDEPDGEDIDGEMVRDMVNVPAPEPEDDNGYADTETGEIVDQPSATQSNGKPDIPNEPRELMALVNSRVQVPYDAPVHMFNAIKKEMGEFAWPGKQDANGWAQAYAVAIAHAEAKAKPAGQPTAAQPDMFGAQPIAPALDEKATEIGEGTK
jgi:hypothetical protein